MSLFLIGGTNVMQCYWWHKCHILTIGGTNVAVGEMSWWDKCQVGQMSVGQMSVGQMSVGQKSRHRIVNLCDMFNDAFYKTINLSAAKTQLFESVKK
jgi:hypothetical protein